ncbi:adhesion G protein-coupled receptor F5-like isoform X2 [Thunnus thynnus]|uniref:adhesion G protein-coupled receptor F5-like isoform X2 n=1 Tax=Thunnus thynnus TaxID=8237 RepID=UPI003527E51B
MCSTFGKCNNITDNTCGCINAIPPDGIYCQPLSDLFICPSPTPPTDSTPVGTTDVATTTVASTIITNTTPIATTDLNTTTPTITPSTVVTNSTPVGTTNLNTTAAATTSLTVITNSTPVATTHMNTTTLTTSPTTVFNDSTTVATTNVNTTTVTPTPTTSVTNSTPVATTHMNTTTLTTSPTTVFNDSTTVATTNVNTTTVTPTPTTSVTNSTPVATTHMNTTTLTTSPTTVFNDSTTVATANVNTTTVTPTPTTSVTNSTNIVTTHLNTTSPATTPTTIITNSTPTATTVMNTIASATPILVTNSTTTTNVNTTTVTKTPLTIVTNSTPVATTHMNTTIAATPTTFITYSTPIPTPDETSTTAATPTSAVTDLTPHETTHQNTTSHTSAPVTEVTNSTLIATTTTTRPTTVITNSTTIATTPTTIVTNSTPAVTTTKTQPTTIITTTHVTSQNTTVSSTSEVTSTPALTTTTSTKASATTTTVPNMTTTMTITTTTTSTTATSTPSATSLTTTASTTVTTPPASTTASATAGFDVEMLIRLDKQYTPELNDATSSTYKELESRIDSVLEEQYKGITGFINVFVRAFREGSIITDFVVQTRQINSDEIAKANQKLPEAMEPIAPVIGSVTALYNSPTSISIPNLTYTGKAMTLTCGPPPENINIGQISDSRWKFRGLRIEGSGRFTITTPDNTSVLRIDNVILADAGLYECTLIGNGVMDFLQKGDVTKIKQAPVVRLQSKVNVQCKLGQIQPLQCCVQSNYKVKWFQGTTVLQSDESNDLKAYCIKHNYQIDSCSESEEKKEFICRVDDPKDYSMTTTMIIFRGDVKCDDAQYGKGRDGDRSSIRCDEGQEGSKTAVCKEGAWTLEEDSCILTDIKELLIDSQDLVVEQVPNFVANLSKAVQEDKTEIANSSATISAIVDILSTIANVDADVNESIMEDVLKTVDVIIADDAKQSWEVLNANKTQNASSELLGSLETLSEDLTGEFGIVTQRIQLNRTMFNKNYSANLNSSVDIDIPNSNTDNVFITTITFSTLNNVMPARNSSFDTSINNATNNNATNSILANTINAAVVLVKTNASIQNVTFSFDKRNNSLTENPQCVFWNFTLLDNLGAWDDEGCKFVSDINNIVKCSCNHLTSFSILMATNIPKSIRKALDIITYVGVGISMASLVICLIIEGYVWKAITRNSTAFMRHVSIVNTALSLLIANICFIIGAAIAKNPLENPGEDHKVPVGPCSTATFFMHFFYLALFFWMLVSGLLLFYRTVMVFSHMSKSTMLAIGFSLGYGCPLIIAVITVAVTAPVNGYIRKDNACWLNWKETKALLALVIPALTIVLMNILIIIVVLFKMLRRGVGDTAQSDEKHTLVVIARCVIILTPLFGLTWSLGVGTMISPENKGIHIAFAFFNSLQGFFILVFGTLLDSKIRSILSRQSPTSSMTSNPTRSTSGIPSSGGIPSFSGTNLISRLRGRRYIYHVSEAANHSNSTDLSESFVSI